MLSDGSFFASEEYGPSLLKVSAQGEVLERWVPAGAEDAMATSEYVVRGALPAIAVTRRINRGFEALGISPDEQWLYVMFQSALTPGVETVWTGSAPVRIWKIDAVTGAVAAQHLYRFDAPETFLRDAARGVVTKGDLKIGDIFALGCDRLLVLERISHSTKIYEVRLTDLNAAALTNLEIDARPRIEDMGEVMFAASGMETLPKRLVFSSDSCVGLGPDIEGMVVLSPNELLLVSDNDFGVEGAETGFWRVTLETDLERV